MSVVGDTFALPFQPLPYISVCPKPESTYAPTASSPAAVVAPLAPDDTVAGFPVVPDAMTLWSTDPAPDALDRPEYSTAATPMSAALLAFAATWRLVPAPPPTTAVQTDSSVPSRGDSRDVTLVYTFPPESVTDEALAAALLQTPTTTTIR
jgi:hypothetical protein